MMFDTDEGSKCCESACVVYLLRSTLELLVHCCLQSAIIHLSALYDRHRHLVTSLTRT